MHQFHFFKMRALTMPLHQWDAEDALLSWFLNNPWPGSSSFPGPGQGCLFAQQQQLQSLCATLYWSFSVVASDYLSSVYWWHPERAILQICQTPDIVCVPHNPIRISLQGTRSKSRVLFSQSYAMTSQRSIFHKFSLLTGHWIIHVPDNISDLTQQS